jgi:hypothetical protein
MLCGDVGMSVDMQGEHVKVVLGVKRRPYGSPRSRQRGCSRRPFQT